MSSIRTRITNRGVIQETMPGDNDASLKIEVPITGGGLGGGGTVIEDGGSLSGTYEDNVLCRGSVTMTGDVIVYGNLNINGSITNDAGWDLQVSGNLHAGGIFFDHADQGEVQGLFEVGGDIHYGVIEYRQSGGTTQQLRVGGDLIGNTGYSGSPIFMNGVNETSGGNILVYGDLIGGPLDLDGASSSSAVSCKGGDVIVYGDCILLDGHDASGGSASDSSVSAGDGGFIDIYGDYICEGNTNLSGGSHSSSGNGGNGGFVDVEGDLRTRNDLELNGGNSSTGTGGDGGNVTVKGNMNISDDFRIRGGGGSSGGSAGSLTVRGDVYVNDQFDAYGGNGNNGSGGGGAAITVRGDFRSGIDENSSVDIYGGNATNGWGGAGGSLNVDGDIALMGDLYLNGGDCNSTNESHYAGTAGSFECANYNNFDYYAYVNGGYRSGTTTVSNTGNNTANGGNIFIQGNAVAYGLYANGGTVATNAPNSAGGNGGSIYIEGNVVAQFIEINGGDSNGSNGGFAGGLEVEGSITADDVLANGGSSLVAPDASPATTAGPGTNYMYIRSSKINSLSVQDGNNGTAPTASINLYLIGNNVIPQMDVPDRVNVGIRANEGASLRVMTMYGKNTLTNDDGSSTADITALNANKSSTFVYGNGLWWALQGVAI